MRSTFCKNIVFNLHSICIPVCFFRLTHFRMVVGFATTYATSAYHHWKCEFEPRSRRGVLDATLYAKVCQWLAVFFPNKTDRHDIPEILLTLNTINQTRIYLNVTNVVYQFKKSLKLRKGNTKLSIEVGQTIQCLIKKKTNENTNNGQPNTTQKNPNFRNANLYKDGGDQWQDKRLRKACPH